MRGPIVSLAGVLAALALVVVTPCEASAAEPGVADIQGAYERAAAEPGVSHVDGLKVVGAQCSTTNGRHYCQIGFTVANAGDDRVYLDAVSLEEDGDARWTLLSGLCRR